MKRLRLLPFFLVLALAVAQDRVQVAMQRGNSEPASKLLKEIRKDHSFSIEKFPMGLKVTLYTPDDLIALASAEARRRHQDPPAGTAAQVMSSGIYRVQLEAKTSNGYAFMATAWEPPEVHMTLTANGHELQPSQEDLGAAFQDGFGQVNIKTLFTFSIPGPIQTMKVTIISANGSEKSRAIDPERLVP